MTYNFVEFFKNLDYYAIIDGVILVATLVLLGVFFIKKRNYKTMLILLGFIVLDLLLNICSELLGGDKLVIAKYITHLIVFATIVITIVVYQSDLRALFQRINSPRGILTNAGVNTTEELNDATTEILTACQNMAKQDIGAIIIIDSQCEINDTILDSGTKLDATLTSQLLESIFNTKAPLHDGAVIVRGNKIVAAGCFLTLTQKNVNKEMGTRHRAAIGVTEDTGVLSIVISEETGIISVVKSGEIRRYMTMDKLKDEIEEAYGISPTALAKMQAQNDKKHHGRL